MNTITMKKSLGTVVAIAAGLGAGVSQAALMGYTDVNQFNLAVANLGGNVVTHGFDSSPTGVITLGSTIDGIRFESASLDGSGGLLSINNEPQPTKSELNQVGNNDGGSQGQLLDGDSFTIGVEGVFAVGMYFNFAGPADLPPIFGFTVTVDMVDSTFQNGRNAENIGSSTVSYFVGAVESAGSNVIDSATVFVPDLGGGIEFSVDDFKTAATVSLPSSLVLFCTALGIAGAVRGSRRS